MYKMIIVDDEKIILDGLHTSLNWESLNIQIVGAASNAKEALELYQNLEPDIILSDIKMPENTGIELLEWVKEINPDTEVVFLSGYSDFEYARKGLQLGAFDYLLKTNIFTELKGVMERLTISLDKKRTMEKEYKNSMNVKNRFLFFEFLRGEENINIVDVKKKYYGLVSLWHDMDQLESELFTNQYRSPIPYIMGNQGQISCYVFWGNEKHRLMDTMESLVNEIEDWFSKKEENSVSLQYTLVESIQEISIMFRYSMKAIDLEKYMNHYEKKYLFKPKKSDRERIDYYDQAKNLVSQIRSQKCSLGKNETDQLFKELYEDEMISYFDVSQILQFFLMEVLNTIDDIDDKLFLFGKQVLNNLPKRLSIIRMQNEVEEFLEKLKLSLSTLGQSDVNVRINEAKRYVDEHYSSQLKMPEIAKKFYLSPAYFSVQFKKVVGKSFSEYLSLIRLKVAYELLQHSNDKVYEIARRVGYNDERHFSKQFKCQYGISPKALQKRNR